MQNVVEGDTHTQRVKSSVAGCTVNTEGRFPNSGAQRVCWLFSPYHPISKFLHVLQMQMELLEEICSHLFSLVTTYIHSSTPLIEPITLLMQNQKRTLKGMRKRSQFFFNYSLLILGFNIPNKKIIIKY